MDYRLQLFKMGLENFYPGWGDAKLAYLLHDYRCHWMGPALHSVLYLVGTPRISAWLQRPSQSGHGHEQKMERKQLRPCSWSLSRPGRWLELWIRFYSVGTSTILVLQWRWNLTTWNILTFLILSLNFF